MSSELQNQRITRLEVENVKRIKAVVIEPGDDPLVIIRGENGQGKSSAIDSIEYGVAGAGSHPPEVVRSGEKMARVVIKTQDLTVTRRWIVGAEATTTELEVRANDGTKLPSPQKVLDKLYDELAFEALEFVGMKKAEQVELMKKLTGCDTTAIERLRAESADARKLLKRDVDAAEARLAAMPTDKPPPAIDTVALLKEQAEAQRIQQRCAATVQEMQSALRRMDDAKEAVRVSEMALAQAQTRHQLMMKLAGDAERAQEEAEEAAANTPATLERVRSELAAAQVNAAASAKWAERVRLEQDLERFTAEYEGKDEEVKGADKRKADLIAKAKFPIDGLGFGGDGVTYNGLPFEQASQAEQLRVSVAIGAARQPKLRVMTVKEGSRLDKKSLALLAQLAKEKEMQVWLECVDEDGPATVVIRDGQVLEGK